MTDATNVTQEARNAAWPFVPSNSVAGSDPAGFLSGLYDDCEAVKAFACFEEEVRTAAEAVSKAEIAEQLDDKLNRGMVGVKRSLEWLEGYCAAATIARALLAKHQTGGRG